jgi:hypothetical protein
MFQRSNVVGEESRLNEEGLNEISGDDWLRANADRVGVGIARAGRWRSDRDRVRERSADEDYGRGRCRDAGGRCRGACRRRATMIGVPPGVRVWIATGHTDMRRGMNSLALQALKRDPHGGEGLALLERHFHVSNRKAPCKGAVFVVAHYRKPPKRPGPSLRSVVFWPTTSIRT